MLVSLKWTVMRILHTFLPLVVALVYRYVCRVKVLGMYHIVVVRNLLTES